LEGQKDVVVVTKTGSAMDIETSTMSINEMLRYRDTIIKNLAEASKDVEILRIEEVNCIRTIDELHRKVQ
jgi:hydroxymethylpyrimidine/phosphomethylpyrimidine kinase